MNKIVIGVSHRIDMDCKCIKNPLYHHMRCGAVDDARKHINIDGDNTGDNISDKHDYLSEFTVQYWLWKNVKADYYGLCHYRRYISFADKEFPVKMFQGFIEEQKINRRTCRRYALNNYFKMRSEIKKYDVIYGRSYDVKKTPTRGSEFDSYRKTLLNHLRTPFTKELLDCVEEIVREKYPQYYPTLIEHLDGHELIGFNIFIMKRELFFQMCSFEFDCMEEMFKRIDLSKLEGNGIRIIGYMGEVLYGTFIRWLRNQNKYKMASKQMVLFWKPQKNKTRVKGLMNKKEIKERLKKIMLKISPTYRVVRRIEEKQDKYLNYRAIKAMLDRIAQKQELAIWLSRPMFPENMAEVKKQFWRGYPKAQGDLRTIQEGSMWLLHRMKAMCDELGVKFWLHGGSLVGGLRHDGFVPWDDDIDAAMMRNDYIKLKEHLKENREYKIQEIYYASLGCRSYRFMRKDMTSNAFVDIFLYDYYLPTENDILHDWGKLIDFKLAMKAQILNLVSSYGVQPWNEPLDDMPELKERLDKLIDMYCNRVISKEPTDWIAWGLDNNFENPSRPAWKLGRIFQAFDIYPLLECKFEGETMYAPNNYEKYIFTEYGSDYLDMPGDMNISKHLKTYFSQKSDLDALNSLIENEKQRGE